MEPVLIALHYQGTEMLINELIKYNKYFELMSYPKPLTALVRGEGTEQHLSKPSFTKYLGERARRGAR